MKTIEQQDIDYLRYKRDQVERILIECHAYREEMAIEKQCDHIRNLANSLYSFCSPNSILSITYYFNLVKHGVAYATFIRRTALRAFDINQTTIFGKSIKSVLNAVMNGKPWPVSGLQNDIHDLALTVNAAEAFRVTYGFAYQVVSTLNTLGILKKVYANQPLKTKKNGRRLLLQLEINPTF